MAIQFRILITLEGKGIKAQIRDVLSEDNDIEELLSDVENLKKKYSYLSAS